jgi:hypothetical protein
MNSRLLVLLALVVAVLGTPVSGVADSVAYYYLAPLSYNGTPLSINNAGDIVGITTNPSGAEVGFLDLGGQITLIAFPGASSSRLTAISNSGLMAGQYLNPAFPPSDDAFVGFVYNGTSFSTVSYPGAWTTGTAGINSSGEVVGSYALGVPTFPTQLGGYTDVNGVFSSIVVPGSESTEATGINDSGEIIGFFSNGTQYYGFVDDAGIYREISYPGACFTLPLGINSAAEVMGYYSGGCGTGPNHYFLWQDGVFTPIHFDDAGASNALGLNDSGEFVGEADCCGGFAFIALPASAPEPGTLGLLALGSLGLAFWRRRRAGTTV